MLGPIMHVVVYSVGPIHAHRGTVGRRRVGAPTMISEHAGDHFHVLLVPPSPPARGLANAMDPDGTFLIVFGKLALDHLAFKAMY